MSNQLPPEVFKRLHNALLDAFPNRSNLEQLVRFSFKDQRFEQISSDRDSGSSVFDLIQWAEANGHISELVTAALEERPRSTELQAVAAQLGLATGTVPHAAHFQLPAPPANFTGRRQILADLLQDLERQTEARVAFAGVHGNGGVGKTALMQVLAHRIKDRYPDAQLYLEMNGVGVDPEPLTTLEAMEQVVRVFRPELALPDSEAQMARLYQSTLQGRRVLLLMDNVRGEAQISPLLPPPGCALLITSRFRFQVAGWQTRGLHQMSAAEAEEFLRNIDLRAAPGARRIAELCGYFPLALRLAGSLFMRRPDWTAERIIAELEQNRVKPLTDEIHASIALSEALLPEPLRTHWRRLSIFGGSFELEDAAAIWSLDLEQADQEIATLLQCCLLDWEEDGYKLHNLVREYGKSRLGHEEFMMVSLHGLRFQLKKLKHLIHHSHGAE